MDRLTLPSGIELDYVDVGPRDAPVLMFLHGFPESHRTWRHQIAYFSDHYRCIAPDQRGYCGSSKPQEVSAYTPDKLIGDVFALAACLGIENFTVVGHDWGGAIAWGVALMGQANGKVTRAVIANAPHPALFQSLLYLDPAQRAASQYMSVFRDPASDAQVREHGLGAVLIKAFGGPDLGALPDADKSRLLAMAADPGVVDEQLADWQDRDAAFAMLNWYRASPVVVPPIDAPFDLPADRQTPALPPLAIPTLVIWGMDDRALLPCNLDGLDAIIPNLTMCPIPGASHFVTWGAPEAFNGAMEAFLAST
ncbi:MAG: alpha/beta hydrolase [Novosphingobium sp.]